MTLDKLKPGMIVWDVHRQKMGNTTMSSMCTWSVEIISVDVEKGIVVARWNGNQARMYWPNQWRKWRLVRPTLVRSGLGYRLATRAELKLEKEGTGTEEK